MLRARCLLPRASYCAAAVHQPAHQLESQAAQSIERQAAQGIGHPYGCLSHPAVLTLTHARHSTRYLPNVLRSKPIITDLVSPEFLKWNMTINPENFTPLMSYPEGG